MALTTCSHGEILRLTQIPNRSAPKRMKQSGDEKKWYCPLATNNSLNPRRKSEGGSFNKMNY